MLEMTSMFTCTVTQKIIDLLVLIQSIGVPGNASRNYVVALQKCQKKKRDSFLFKVKMISV